MAGINRGHRDHGVELDQIVGGRNVIAGFIPEEGKPQQRGVKNKDCGKDDGEDVDRMKTRWSIWQGLWQLVMVLRRETG